MANPVFRWVSVLTVCVLFVVLRWDTWPKTYFADELIPLAVVKHMEQTGTLDTNWDNADWRGDYAAGVYDLRQYNFSSYHVALRSMKWLAAPWTSAVTPIVFYRACSLLFQCLALVLLMDVLRRLAGWPQALIAGLFFTVMPQSVIDAHYARPETFVTLLVALGMWLGFFSCDNKNGPLPMLFQHWCGVWRLLAKSVYCRWQPWPGVLLCCASCHGVSRWRGGFYLCWVLPGLHLPLFRIHVVFSAVQAFC